LPQKVKHISFSIESKLLMDQMVAKAEISLVEIARFEQQFTAQAEIIISKMQKMLHFNGSMMKINSNLLPKVEKILDRRPLMHSRICKRSPRTKI
jgi:hypothetical protein